MVAGVVSLVPETLPPERRHGGGLKALISNLRYVVRNQHYLGYALAFVFGFGALFAYISASPFVVQNVLGLSPSQFSIVFAVNATGMVTAAMITTRLLGRVGARNAAAFRGVPTPHGRRRIVLHKRGFQFHEYLVDLGPTVRGNFEHRVHHGQCDRSRPRRGHQRGRDRFSTDGSGPVRLGGAGFAVGGKLREKTRQFRWQSQFPPSEFSRPLRSCC